MNLGPMELVLILGIALLLFGPSRLPGLGKSMGDAIRGFKKGIDGEEEKEAATRPEQLRDASAVEAEAQKNTEKKSEKKEV
jgi:sec-independent protein translocase protein TatA